MKKLNFTMSIENYNLMIDFAKGFIDKKAIGEQFKFIQVEIDESTAIINVSNGYKAGILTVLINNTDSIAGEFFFPVTNKLKKSDVFAIFDVTEESVSVRTANTTTTHKIPPFEVLDFTKFMPTDAAKETFGINPVYLSDALKAFKNHKSVKIEYHSPTSPLVIKAAGGESEAKAIVLPVRL